MPLTPLAWILVLISSALIVALPRRLVCVPFFAAVLWIPIGQSIDIGGLNFYFGRILGLVGISRVIIRREHPIGMWNGIDKIMAIWGLVLLVTSIFHRADLITVRLGLLYDTITVYALFRCIIRDFEDFTVAARAFSIITIPIAIALIIERSTGYNWFATLGGVEEFSQIRDGLVRAQGSFSHPINAGIVGAFNIGLSFFLFSKYRKTAIYGFLGGVLIVYASSSSGPVMGTVTLAVMSLFYPWREYARKYMMWAIVAMLLTLHLAMKAPVWYLIARLKVFGGSTAWYRAELIDSTFEHIGEWWLYGTDNTIALMPFGRLEDYEGVADITSQYIKMMVTGGFGLFVVFVLLLYYGFKYVSILGRQSETRKRSQWCPFEAWAVTAILVFFTVTFVTISYFGQIIILWVFIIAAISSWWSITETQSHFAVE
jgi:hypothetical protein